MSSSSVLPDAPALVDDGPLLRAAAAVGRALSWVAFAACYVFLYAPLATITAFSFNDSTSQALPYAGLTTRWYRQLLHDDAIIRALEKSLVVALGAVLVAAVVGTSFALLFDHVRSRATGVLVGALTIPFLLPGMVLGLSLAITFRALGVSPGTLTIVVGHATFVMPIVLHSFIIGQPYRLRGFRRVIEHIKKHEDRVWITKAGDICAHIESLPPGVVPGTLALAHNGALSEPERSVFLLSPPRQVDQHA